MNSLSISTYKFNSIAKILDKFQKKKTNAEAFIKWFQIWYFGFNNIITKFTFLLHGFSKYK